MSRETEQIHVRVLKDDVDYLRSISEVKGDLTYHIRTAVNQYVRCKQQNIDKLIEEEQHDK